MEQRENLLDVLKIFFKWWKPIAYLSLCIGLISVLISLLLPNYFESTTIFYASSVDQAKPGQIFGTSTRDIEFYGDDRDNDRLMTIAESNELSDYIIQEFDLYRHYDIDSTKEKAAFRVREKFNKHYTVIKTKRDAIELSIEDQDKKLAADMVNSARDKVNELAISIIKDQLLKLKESLNKNIQEKSDQLSIIGDSIQALKNRYGIFNTLTQGDVFADQTLSASARLAREQARFDALKRSNSVPKDTLIVIAANIAGLKSELSSLKNSTFQYNQGLSRVIVLERQEKDMSTKLSMERVQLNQLMTTFNSPLSAINLIEEGHIPIIKSRPKRSLIVISAVLIAFVFSLVGVLLFESYRDIDWDQITKTN